MDGLCIPLLYQPARHLVHLIRRENYFTYSWAASRLGSRARFVPGELRLFGHPFRYVDAASFLSGFREIFVEKIYDFAWSQERPPRILDLGANIGLSVLFFKRIYPEATVEAFEADPKVFSALEHNVRAAELSGVTLHNQAAWAKDTELSFFSEGADAGRVSVNEGQSNIRVQAIDLGAFLARNSFDLLKMDIEGAEEILLPHCQPFLRHFQYIFVEYHSRVAEPQCLDRLLAVLREEGFRVHLHSVPASFSPSPFRLRREYGGFDLQLNIFAWKGE